MGNAVHGTQGALVYANSPGTGAIRFLNTAVLSAPTRASDGFQETVAQGVVDLGIGELLGAGLMLSAKVASKLFGYPSEFLGEGAAVFKDIQGVKGGVQAGNMTAELVTHRPVAEVVAEANAPINEAGISQATRAWDKLAGRPGGTFDPLTGTTAEKNAIVSNWVNEVLTNPQTTRTQLPRGGVEKCSAL